jgi:hypothetical protein
LESIILKRVSIRSAKASVRIILVRVASGFSGVSKNFIRFVFCVAEGLTEAPVYLANGFNGDLGQGAVGGDGECPPFCIARSRDRTIGVELDCGFDVHGFSI